MDKNEMKNFRNNLFNDLYTNKIPQRVPIQDAINIEFLIQYAGKDLLLTQFDYTTESVSEIYEKAINEIMRGDLFNTPYAGNAIANMLEGNLMDQLGKTGMIQHPEQSYMAVEEYDEYIKAPFDFLIEKVSQRNSAQFAKQGAFRSRALLMRQLAINDQNAIMGAVGENLAEKHGLLGIPAGSSALTWSPYDFIADYCRGFAQIALDIRRMPGKLHDALDATMPYMVELGMPSDPHLLGASCMMTHMGGFMNNKHFEEFYFPHFNDLAHILASQGVYMSIFLEQDWTRFLDFLEELPMGTRYYMEYGDMHKFKNVLGKKFVLGGFYPLVTLRTGTREKCIDKAKEILDIMAPGGNYYFTLDKNALNLDDIKVENYTSVYEYVRDNSTYENAGQTVSSLNREDTINTNATNKYPKLNSKYIMSFDEYKKEYPPVREDVEPYMRKAYNKYLSQITLMRSC